MCSSQGSLGSWFAPTRKVLCLMVVLTVEEVPDTVLSAVEDLRNAKIRVGTMDCSETLPSSGKTVYERFNIKPKRKVPVVIFTVNGQAPEIVEAKNLEVC